MRAIHLAAALPLTCLFAGAAFAQGACTKPLAMVDQIQMESRGGGPASVPVKINGTDQKLTLATAGTTTQINEDAAKALNLDIHRADSVLLSDENGRTSRDEVTISDFMMGKLHGSNVKWPVSLGGGRGFGGGDDAGAPGGGAAARPIGLLSLNYLAVYDVGVDFGSDKLAFFNQDHCPGGVLYWKPPGAVGVLPMAIQNGRIVTALSIDGKTINAVINTASPFSSVRRAVAERVLGVTLGGPKAPARPGGFGGQSWTWTPDSVALNQLKLEGVKFNVQPDINANAGDGAQAQRARASGIQFELDNPEVVLGMDALRKLHLFFSFAEKRLYATASETASATAAPKAP